MLRPPRRQGELRGQPPGADDALHGRVFTPQVDSSACSLPFFLLASHIKFLEPRGHLALAPCDIPVCGPVLGWWTWRREA